MKYIITLLSIISAFASYIIGSISGLVAFMVAGIDPAKPLYPGYQASLLSRTLRFTLLIILRPLNDREVFSNDFSIYPASVGRMPAG
jgi:hypothetical protein